MIGMADKRKTRAIRIAEICVLTALLSYCVLDIHKFHGMLRFGTGMTIAVALMGILHEIRELLEEPN
jgi:hypothetical protein